MARPRTPLISLDRVVEAATRILETEGLHALSLRALGARMGVNSASLYHHFASKDDILLAVARTALREIVLPPISDDWATWLCDNAVAYRRVLVKKPYLLDLILHGIRPRTLAYTQSEARLIDAGVPDDLRPEFLIALDSAVIGSALVSIDAEAGSDGQPHFDHEAILRSTIQLMVRELMEQAMRYGDGGGSAGGAAGNAS